MTLTELRYAITLSETEHFGKAAEACHVSQPALSSGIKNLEEELDVLLFERNKTELQITDIGSHIIDQAKQIIEEVETLKAIARAGKSQLTEPLKIAAIYTIGSSLFTRLIPQLNIIAPKMPLIIQEDFDKNLRDKLLQGNIDAMFISLPFEEKGIVTHELYTEPFVIVMRQDHPLSKQHSISVEDLAKEEILLLSEGHCFRKQVIESCSACIQQGGIQKTVEGTSLETLRDMVASGMGITILPLSAVKIDLYNGLLCVKPFADKVPQRTVALAWRVSFTRPKAIDALIKALAV